MDDLSDILDKTLQELDGEDWGEPNFPSRLVQECHRLRSVPLRDFTVEDIRITIGQNVSLDYLLPLALGYLEVDPWVSGSYYEGDLLSNVLRIDRTFWAEHDRLKHRLDNVVSKALDAFLKSSVDDSNLYDESVLRKLENWHHGS